MIGICRVVAEEEVAAVVAADDFSCVGVEQQLGGVETMAFVGCPGAVDSVAVDQAFATAWQQAVPDAVCAGGQPESLLLVLPGALEKTELYGLCGGGCYCEVDALRCRGCAQGEWGAWAQHSCCP